ncbi:MAG: HDIG domain-containing protein [Patescibacteria group bacterium]|nr:HDIG domain-containing protein [Patescibacteria group bacterium]MDD4610374.1 HDIG domain-containing protein [Patescibacteria group bacterium]
MKKKEVKPLEIIRKYYKPGTKLYHILITHSRKVAQRALQIAKNYQDGDLDLKFIEEAAMLHDIGVFLTDEPNIYCFGKEPFIKHGILGARILRKEGLRKHALVCERHIGVGLSRAAIIKQKMPLPKKDFLCQTPEEEIICLSDLFFTKIPSELDKEKKLSEIRKKYARYGRSEAARLEKLINKYWK